MYGIDLPVLKQLSICTTTNASYIEARLSHRSNKGFDVLKPMIPTQRVPFTNEMP